MANHYTDVYMDLVIIVKVRLRVNVQPTQRIYTCTVNTLKPT